MEQKNMKKKGTKLGGFTLIEMVVVIAVIGVLMTLAFRGTGAIQAGARDVKRVKSLNDAKALLEQYYAAYGTYPVNTDPAGNGTALKNTCALASSTAADWTNLAVALKNGKVIDVEADLPDDPTKARHYCYAVKSDGTTYRLGAVMERRVPSDSDTNLDFITDCTTANNFCVKP